MTARTDWLTGRRAAGLKGGWTDKVLCVGDGNPHSASLMFQWVDIKVKAALFSVTVEEIRSIWEPRHTRPKPFLLASLIGASFLWLGLGQRFFWSTWSFWRFFIQHMKKMMDKSFFQSGAEKGVRETMHWSTWDSRATEQFTMSATIIHLLSSPAQYRPLFYPASINTTDLYLLCVC